jgi:hypothetical protein
MIDEDARLPRIRARKCVLARGRERPPAWMLVSLMTWQGILLLAESFDSTAMELREALGMRRYCSDASWEGKISYVERDLRFGTRQPLISTVALGEAETLMRDAIGCSVGLVSFILARHLSLITKHLGSKLSAQVRFTSPGIWPTVQQ